MTDLVTLRLTLAELTAIKKSNYRLIYATPRGQDKELKILLHQVNLKILIEETNLDTKKNGNKE